VDDLIKRIQELENISGELEPSEQKRDLYNQQVQDYVNQFLNSIGEAKAFSEENVVKGSLALDRKRKTIPDLMKIYSDEVASTGINAASGGHIGYIPGGGIYTSALADYLAAVTNEYAGLYYASPGAVTIENEILRWLKSIFGFPPESAGSLTSGGSIANMIGLTAARDRHGIKSGNVPKSVVYLSPHTHHCIHKALKIIGLEDVIIRYLQPDENFRIKPAELGGLIEKDKIDGLNPFIIIASAGTTDTGAVDPLKEIGEIARRNNLWYHIDAAYGGFFILTESRKKLFHGIEMADSLVTDPHKGLFLPYGTGAVLVKDKEAVLHSNRYTANYMQDSAQTLAAIDNPADVSPELTRHFRALRVWLPLQVHGIEPFIACLEEKLMLTAYFRNRLADLGFKTGPVPDLSVSYFWYPSEKVDEDIYNRRLLEIIHKDGNIFFSSTKINNRFVIRMAILSFRTKRRTIDRAIEIIRKARMQLDAEYSV
jgi:aromatic-L-amino-acid/L-tryptophan decarboxylase